MNGLLANRPAVRTGTPEATALKNLLRNVALEVGASLEHDSDQKPVIQIGCGNGYVPRVPWIFISLEGGPVSSKRGIAICFGRGGNGFVFGEMYPLGVSAGQTSRTRRKRDPFFIDVDGDSFQTRYNNRFINPVEVFVDAYDETHFHQTLRSVYERL